MATSILAVIPARGNSKGIKRKNLRLFNGKPLIFYQIQNALRSKYISNIVVSSEDKQILRYASNFGVYIRERPKELSEDDIPLDPVVFDAVNYLESKLNIRYEFIITLQPTSPLLTSDKLDYIIELMISGSYDTIIPVCDATHLYWNEKEGSIVPDFTERLNRQWLKKKYKETGAFLITRRNYLSDNNRFGNIIYPFVLKDFESIDIDNEIDWITAENLMKRLKIAFVVNGNDQIGTGHINRVITIANSLIGHEISIFTTHSDRTSLQLLEDSGYEIVICDHELLISNLANYDIVINDILDTKKDYIINLKKNNLYVVCFEDLGEGSNEANIVFNALYEMTNHRSNHRFSYEYECLNEKFYLFNPITFKNEPQSMLITFGGVDINNLTCKVLKLAPMIFNHTSIENLDVVVGAGFSHKKALSDLEKQFKDYDIKIHQNIDYMADLMSRADLAITSNGRTIYELSAMGVPTISIAQNDRETLHLFARYSKGIRYLGIACTILEDTLLRNIVTLCNDKNLRKSMHSEQLKSGTIIRQGIFKVTDEIIEGYWKNKYEEDMTYEGSQNRK